MDSYSGMVCEASLDTEKILSDCSQLNTDQLLSEAPDFKQFAFVLVDDLLTNNMLQVLFSTSHLQAWLQFNHDAYPSECTFICEDTNTIENLQQIALERFQALHIGMQQCATEADLLACLTTKLLLTANIREQIPLQMSKEVRIHWMQRKMADRCKTTQQNVTQTHKCF